MSNPDAFTLWLAKLLGSPKPPTLQERARSLVAAVDAGGLPLNAAIVNNIARQLGLDVSVHAAMPDTIARIREVLERDVPPAPKS